MQVTKDVYKRQARVWADVGSFAECRGGKYCICSVTGPDEYNVLAVSYTHLHGHLTVVQADRPLVVHVGIEVAAPGVLVNAKHNGGNRFTGVSAVNIPYKIDGVLSHPGAPDDQAAVVIWHRLCSLPHTVQFCEMCIRDSLTGTLLLMLPVSSKSGTVSPFLNCLFTATSASCVTGLIVYDTWTHWSVFGQLVIITLIQIGGLGFITIGVFLSMVLRRKIGLKERGLMQESVNTLQIGGMVRLAKKIIIGTVLFEGTGALIDVYKRQH